MNLYIVTLKFRERAWSDNTMLLKRVITGKWVVRAKNIQNAIEDASENRGEIIEATAIELQGDGIFCLEYNGESKL